MKKLPSSILTSPRQQQNQISNIGIIEHEKRMLEKMQIKQVFVELVGRKHDICNVQ